MGIEQINISASGITDMIHTEYIGKDFHYFDTLTSTFDKAQDIEVQHGTVICTGIQTNGRGRLGRQWESQAGGIYFSLILKNDINCTNPGIVTIICALGVCNALEEYIPCKIKWPNDIITLKGKKLCGILTRMQTVDNNTGYLNIGIGINANNCNFNHELIHATSLKTELQYSVNPDEVLCKVLESIESVLKTDETKVMKHYRQKCVTLNTKVRIVKADGSGSYTAECIDINPDGSLKIKNDDETVSVINSGEVSVRGVYGENYV